MDSLAYAQAHSDEWARLETLARRSRLSGAESDELVQLYQRTAAQLAYIRTNAPDPDVILRLSAVLARARSRITLTPVSAWSVCVHFVTIVLPVAFYRIRHWIWAVTAACLAVSFFVFAIYAFNPNLMETLGSYSSQQAYAKQAFEAYYFEYSHSDFSLLVWTNNAWIAAQCVAAGFTGIYPAYVLLANSANLGQGAAVMYRFDELPIFFQLILPHGQLELMAIFVAGAAGLRIFWVLIAPGDMPRIAALGREGRHTMMVAVGLVFVLLLSGLLEGFLTPSFLPWAVKIGIGSAALIGFWLWIIYFGRCAVARGYAQEDPEETGWHIEYAG